METKMTTLTIRVSISDYQAFKETCKELGLKPSDALHVFIKTTIRNNRIPSIVNAFHTSEKSETTNVTIYLSESDKERFNKVCKNEAQESINLFIKAVIKCQCIPFPVKL